MTVIARNLRLGSRATRRAYLGPTLVFAEEERMQWQTDFGGYAVGSPPSDWTAFATSALDTFEVSANGLVSANCLRIRNTAEAALRTHLFIWDTPPEAVDTETLFLVQRSSRSGTNTLPAAISRMSIRAQNDNTGLILGLRNNATDVTRRLIRNGNVADQDNAPHGASFEPGVAAWVRGRWSGTRFQVRAWVADPGTPDLGLSNEPQIWHLEGDNNTVVTAGSVGFFYSAWGISSPEDSEVFLHYYGVGIDGDNAPAPSLPTIREPDPIPGPDPVPDPDPAPVPDPETVKTFDSTAARFDSTAQTFDEVA